MDRFDFPLLIILLNYDTIFIIKPPNANIKTKIIIIDIKSSINELNCDLVIQIIG